MGRFTKIVLASIALVSVGTVVYVASRASSPESPTSSRAPVPRNAVPRESAKGRLSPSNSAKSEIFVPPEEREPATELDTDIDSTFAFDKKRPLEDQVQDLLFLRRELNESELNACRERAEEVGPIAIGLLEDRATAKRIRYFAVLLLAELKDKRAVPTFLGIIQGNEPEWLRVNALRELIAFGSAVPAKDLESIYRKSRDFPGQYYSVKAMAKAGHLECLPLLADVEQRTTDSEIREMAKRAQTHIRIVNNQYSETDLVVQLHGDDDYLRAWATEKIVERRYPASAQYLRAAFEAQRKLPWKSRRGAYEYKLLRSIQELGGDLSNAELLFIEKFGLRRPDPFK